MIIIDVSIPIIGKIYDFSLDENALVDSIIEEIVEIISQKEGGFEGVESKNMDLFSTDTTCAINRSVSLFENNIINGSRLLLV